jgi:hypothetical protein
LYHFAWSSQDLVGSFIAFRSSPPASNQRVSVTDAQTLYRRPRWCSPPDVLRAPLRAERTTMKVIRRLPMRRLLARRVPVAATAESVQPVVQSIDENSATESGGLPRSQALENTLKSDFIAAYETENNVHQHHHPRRRHYYHYRRRLSQTLGVVAFRRLVSRMAFDTGASSRTCTRRYRTRKATYSSQSFARATTTRST